MKVRVCALIVKDDRVLSLIYHYPSGTVHALPGGTLESGETLAACLEREMTEELSLQIEVGDLRYVGDMPCNGQNVSTVHIVFEGRIIAGEPRLNPQHTSAADWIWLPLSEIEDKLLYPAINEAILGDRGKADPRPKYLGECAKRIWA